MFFHFNFLNYAKVKGPQGPDQPRISGEDFRTRKTLIKIVWIKNRKLENSQIKKLILEEKIKIWNKWKIYGGKIPEPEIVREKMSDPKIFRKTFPEYKKKKKS